MVQIKLELTACLFIGQSSSFPAKINVYEQASTVSCAPRPNAVLQTESEAKNGVLGEFLNNTVNFRLYCYASITNYII